MSPPGEAEHEPPALDKPESCPRLDRASGIERRSAMARRSTVLLACALLVALGACRKRPAAGDDAVSVEPSPPSATAESPAEPPPIALAPAPSSVADAATEPAPLTEEESRIVWRAVNSFAAAAFPRLAANMTNVAFSPTGIVLALAMTSVGARGETAVQLDQTLHLGREAGRTRTLLGRAQRQLARLGGDEAVSLLLAARLFAGQQYEFRQEFLDRVSADFDAPLEKVDFLGNAEAARAGINGWVSRQTRDRIPQLLPPQSFDELTRLVLVSALYFKGLWVSGFPADATRPRPFRRGDGTSVEVQTMELAGRLGYSDDNGAQRLELPYRGGELSMFLVLPPPELPLEAWVTVDALDELGPLPAREVHVLLPRFTIDAPARNLREDLSAMGMPRAFLPGQAQFQGIADPPDPDEQLYLSQVFHKTFVLVDEQGTEAASATAVVMGPSGPPRSAEPATFIADRPFLFFLRDRSTGLILFAGRVGDPASGS
jgi:serpin B